jgi:hypothetical protein
MENNLGNQENYKSSKFFNIEFPLDNHYNSILAGYRISSKSSLAIVFNDYHQKKENKKERGYGINLGLFHKIGKKTNIGLVYFNFSDRLSNYRMDLERFADETLNLGISSELNKDTLLSIDIRNLFNSKKSAFQEVHLGFEKQIKQIGIRGGYFKEKGNKAKFYSYGIGIILNKNYATKKSPSKYALNYSIVQEIDKSKETNFHFLTLVFPLGK